METDDRGKRKAGYGGNEQQSDRRAPGKQTLSGWESTSGPPDSHGGGAPPPSAKVQRDGDEVAERVAQHIHDHLHGWIDDESAALGELQRDPGRRQTCATYLARYGVTLWDDFIDNASGDLLHRALALLWPHMTVLERLSTMLGWDDDEDGILQTIQSASDAELRVARPGIQPYLDELDAVEQFTARQRIWPENAVANVVWLLGAGDGWFWDDEGPVASAILGLTPAQRTSLWTEHREAFGMFNETDLARIRRMCVTEAGAQATEADALTARMELATEGLGTDEDGVLAAIGGAGNRRDELARLTAALSSGKGPSGAPLTATERSALLRRRAEIGEVESLLAPALGAEGRLEENSFLGRVEGDMDAATTDAALTTARVDAFTRAKQALLLTIGIVDVDEDAALLILRNLRGEAPLADGESIESLGGDSLGADEVRRRQAESAAAIRQRLRDDPDLAPVWAALDDEERSYAEQLTRGDTYHAALRELTEAFEGIDTDEAAILRILREVSAADRARLRTEAPPILGRLRSWGLGAAFYRALEEVLVTGHLPAGAALDAAFGGWGDGTDEELASDALAGLSASDRARYRRGYLLAHADAPHFSPASLPPEDRAALEAYRALYARMASEYTDEELDAALVTLLGLPTVAELQHDQGRIDAAALMLFRQRERLEQSGAMTDFFTTTDDTAAAAHVEFEARYHQAMEDGSISLEEFAVLVRLDEQFNGRFQEHSDTVNQVSEIAGTVAAVVAAVVVLVVSGGTAAAGAPGVVAWLGANSTLFATSAATGALAQVVASEASGGDFNEALDAEGARQALSGALNGAMMIAGAALAERAATLVGLTGRALTAQIARSAASATEVSVAGRAFARGALTGLIDGSLSGAVGELAMTLTDAETWRRSVWQVLARAGEALLRGGLLGGVSGAAAGGLLETAQGLLRARAIRGCAVQLDPELGSGAHLDFSTTADGAIEGLTLRFGPATSDGDLAAHIERIATIQRGGTLLLRVRNLIAESKAAPLGTRSGNAAEELPKIEQMIQDRLRQLRSTGLTPESTEIVEAELDVLRANLDDFADVAARRDLTPATGGIGRPDAPPGYPEPPEGHYYRKRGEAWDLQRYPDSDVEPHTLEPDGAGGWRAVAREGAQAAPAARFDEAIPREQAFDQLVGPDSRSSFKQYWEMLQAEGLATREEGLAAMLDPAGRTEASVRHALKESFRSRVLARTMTTPAGAARTEAESLLELQRLTANLNPADRGTLTEAWYASRREGLVAHPEMLPERNPGLEQLRRPDFVEGATAVEVKSTAAGLDERDVVQISDMLGVCSDRGWVTLPDGTIRQVTAMRLVFSDIRGARGSAKPLAEWLRDYPMLTVEVFGRRGLRTEITGATLPALQARHGADSLPALLAGL